MNQAGTPSIYRQFKDLLASDKAAKLSIESLQQAQLWLADHVAERFEELSDAPGVAGNIGASQKQVDFQRAFFEQKHRVYAMTGSNQSGKTECVWGMCFAKYVRDFAVDGDIFWCVAQTHDTMRDIPHRSIWKFLPKSMFPKGIEYKPRYGFGMIPTLHLTLPGGRGKCELWFKVEESDIKIFESARLNGLVWTECKSLKVYHALQPRLAKHKGFMLMDYIATEAWHRFDIRVPAEAGDPDIHYARVAMVDNAHNLPEGEIESQIRRLGGPDSPEAKVRVFGVEGTEFGVVYRNFDTAIHCCKRFKLPNKCSYRCYDYGYNAPFACLWCELLPMGFQMPEGIGGYWDGKELDSDVLVLYREAYENEMDLDTTASIIKSLSGDERYQWNGRIVADPSIWFRRAPAGKREADSIYKLLKQAGLMFKKGKGGMHGMDEHSMVNKVRLWIESRKILVFDDLAHTIVEFQSWRYKETGDGDPTEKFESKHNHAMDALKYLVAENLTYHSSAGMDIIDTLDRDAMKRRKRPRKTANA